IKVGADLRRVELNSFVDRDYRVQVSFTGGYIGRAGEDAHPATGLAFAGLGFSSNITQALAVTPDSSLALRFLETNLFVQDAWHPSPRIVVEAGLRYELNSVPKDARGGLEQALTLGDAAAV